MSSVRSGGSRRIVVGIGIGLLLPLSGLLAQAGRGPTPEELANYRQQYEARYGQAPTPEDAAIEPTRPAFEQPGEIPAEARQYASETELVKIVCAMTRWKSGEFFASMAGVKQYVWPLYDAAKEIDPSVERPDVDVFVAEGDRRVAAICAAADADTAMRLAREFAAWAQDDVFNGFVVSKRDLTAKLNAASEKIRTKVQASIGPLVDEKEASLKAKAQAKADQLVEAMQARFEGRESAPSEAEIAAAVAEVERGVNSYLAPEIAKAEAEIMAAAEASVAPEKAKFETIGRLGREINGQMSAAVQAARATSSQHRDEAVALRRGIILSFVDKSLAEAMTKLEAAGAELESARRNDPSIVSVAQIKAEVATDRTRLEQRLTAALQADDEAAAQAALGDFKMKWEEFRNQAEQASSVGLAAGCQVAVTQFAVAQERITAARSEVAGVVSSCEGVVDERCLAVGNFAPRFGQLDQKMDNLLFGMELAEKLCQDPATADRNELMGVLQQVQRDANDLRTFGEALEADKNQTLAETGANVCSQVLPAVRAARVELQNEDLIKLEASIARCRGQQSDECTAVNTTVVPLNAFKVEAAAFFKEADKFEAACAATPNDELLLQMRDTANFLRARGEKLQVMGQDLRLKQSQAASQRLVCNAAVPSLLSTKQEVARGVSEANAVVAGCVGQTDERCQAVNGMTAVFSDIKGKGAVVLQLIDTTAARCAMATDEPADESLLADLERVRSLGEELRQLAAELQQQQNDFWPKRIKTSRPFKVVLDVAPTKFDDSAWTGDWRTDQMGTIRGGDAYELTYAPGSWSARGYNEGSRRIGTWVYRDGDPDSFKLNIWGRIYKFDGAGQVFDQDYGLVGHLVE